jgi:CrcB protein
MKVLLAIGAGSFIGGVARYVISEYIQSKFFSAFPFGTLIVNVAGCFLIGIVYGLVERDTTLHEWQMFLATGLLGGFTTFSAFSHETVGLLRDGQLWYATAYIAISVIIGLLATFLGLAILKLY